jgi:hypothetical protein
MVIHARWPEDGPPAPFVLPWASHWWSGASCGHEATALPRGDAYADSPRVMSIVNGLQPTGPGGEWAAGFAELYILHDGAMLSGIAANSELLDQMHRVKTDLVVKTDDVQAAQIGTHVLIDSAGLDTQRTTATLALHRPVKDPNNPILREDKLWEDRLHMFGSLVHADDDDEKLLRIYYLVDGQFGIKNCVAESRDGGANWRKPSLGLVPCCNGTNMNSTMNNIVGNDMDAPLSDYYLGWVGRNGDHTDPSRKFIATMGTPAWLIDQLPAACAPFGPTRKRDAAFIAFSADGLTFRMPTSADCYLQSKDDSANPIVFWKNSSLWFNRQDVMGNKTATCPPRTAGPQRKVGVSSFKSLLVPPATGKWPARPTVLTFDDEDPGCLDL